MVFDGFLGEALARACAGRMAALQAHEVLTPAHLGKERVHRADLRGDHTAWLAELDDPGPLAAVHDAFESLRYALNRAAWLGLQRFEVQLAAYPGDGARYVRHVDSFAGQAARRVTAIVYLNPDWQPAHGGDLAAWTPEGEVRIEPLLDRLVLFLSDRLPHAVLPTWERRFAVTAWYRGAEEIPVLADPR